MGPPEDSAERRRQELDWREHEDALAADAAEEAWQRERDYERDTAYWWDDE